MADYILRNIRTLLTEGFSDRELRRFCYDTPEFRPVYDELADLTGKAAIVDVLLEYADRTLLLDRVLAWAKAAKPVRYELHQPYRLSSEPVARLGKPPTVPELPLHYLPRPDDLASVKAALLGREQPVAITGATRKVGLQGMVGIGKSVLAAAIAYDNEVRQAFPDGIFWLTLGQEPNLTTRQAQLAESLGDPIRIFGDAQQGRARLSELLAERTCLLILDDVWQAAHAEAFNALGSQGRLLLTSRDAALIRAMGAAEHRLGVLNQTQALDLLAQWAAQPVETLPPEAKVVAKACGYLPLALAMLGAQVRGKPDRWANVLHKLQTADLSKIRQEFPHYPYLNLLRALQVSVEALEPELQARYLELAVFPEDTPIPEAAAQTLWAAAGLDKYDVQDALDTLVDRSLARRDDRGCLSLHDLQYDYVCKQVGDLTALHGRLVAAYRQQCADGWTSGPDDGYFFDHLAYHLAEAGQREELYALISKEWMDRQFKRTFSHRAFANDVERAIAAGAEEPPNLVQVIRGCLIYATLGELATNVPPEILGVLAQVGQVERALGYASLMQDAIKQSKVYSQIGEILLRQGRLKEGHEILRQALTIAKLVNHESERASIVCEIALALTRGGEFDQAMMILETIIPLTKRQLGAQRDDIFTEIQLARVAEIKAGALSKIAQIMAKKEEITRVSEVFKQAMTTLEVIGDRTDVSGILVKLVHALTRVGELDQASELVQEVASANYQASALGEIAKVLAEMGDGVRAIEFINRTLSMSEAIVTQFSEAKLDKVFVLSKVFEALITLGDKSRAKQVINKALAIASDMEDNSAKVSALCTLALELAQLGDNNKAVMIANEALVIAEPWLDEGKALGKAIQTLVQVGAFDQALSAIEQVGPKYNKAYFLLKIITPLIKAGKLDLVFAAIEAIEDAENKEASLLEAVTVSVQVLTEIGDIAWAIETANLVLQRIEIRDNWAKSRALSMIALALTEIEDTTKATEVIRQALAAAKAETRWDKSRPLEGIVQVLVKLGECDWALDVTNGIESIDYRISALIEVGKGLIKADNSKNMVIELAEQALEMINGGEVEGATKSPLLRGVVSILAMAGAFDRALSITKQIESEWEKVRALTELARAIIEAGESRAAGVIRLILKTVKTIESEWAKAFVLCEVAYGLTKVGAIESATELAYQALLIAKNIKIGMSDKARALNEVALTLVEVGDNIGAIEAVNEALVAVGKNENKIVNTYILRSLSQILAKQGEIKRALTIVEAIEDKEDKAFALSRIAQILAQAGDKNRLATLANQTVETVKGIERYEYRTFSMGRVARDLIHAGQLSQASQVLYIAFATASATGVAVLFETLQHCAPALAALD